MNRSFALLGASMLAVLATGCEKQAATDVDSVKAAIKADEKAWNEQFHAKPRDQEALVAHYADDGYFVAPGVKAADGLTAIRSAYAMGLNDPAFDISFSSDKIDIAGSGDLAYARGHFTEKYTDQKSGKVMSNSGSYITVYRKQQDGGWKAVEDFAVADPGSEKAVAPEKPATRAKMVSF